MHTSEIIPDLLTEIRGKSTEDYLVLCPGICYRRDVVDRTHIGAPHQMDIWRIKKGEPRLERQALIELIEAIIESTIPGAKYRANEVTHPYTINGLEVEILVQGVWLEILECGEVHPQLLLDAGLDPREYSGLASGMGLDRLVMLIKGIDDIRLIRAEDPRIERQMINLDRYQPVSKYPSVRQDMSVSVADDVTEEDVCEMIRDALYPKIEVLEEIKIVSTTPYEQLPPVAKTRLGIQPGQKNMLIRVTLRSHVKSLTQPEANIIRDKIYKAVDQSPTGGYLVEHT